MSALAALGDTQPMVIEDRLHALERKQLLRRERRSVVAAERQYAFRHVLVRGGSLSMRVVPIKTGRGGNLQ